MKKERTPPKAYRRCPPAAGDSEAAIGEEAAKWVVVLVITEEMNSSRGRQRVGEEWFYCLGIAVGTENLVWDWSQIV